MVLFSVTFTDKEKHTERGKRPSVTLLVVAREPAPGCLTPCLGFLQHLPAQCSQGTWQAGMASLPSHPSFLCTAFP